MEFLSTVSNVDNQSVFLIVFSLLLAFMLSALIVFTYDKVSQEVIRPDHFLQSLILMSLVTAIIMQSIGDSLRPGYSPFPYEHQQSEEYRLHFCRHGRGNCLRGVQFPDGDDRYAGVLPGGVFPATYAFQPGK
jgi:hypothetical protein